MCTPFCIPFFGFPVPGILGNYFQVPAIKRNSFPCYFFSKGNFPGMIFAVTMFLQKLVPFLPFLPKGNNSPECRPKMSKRYHTQQHNRQQRISVAALIGHSSYLLPSPPCQILMLVRPPLVVPSCHSCLVGCCVARWPPSASQPVAPPLVAPSVCWLSRGVAP